MVSSCATWPAVANTALNVLQAIALAFMANRSRRIRKRLGTPSHHRSRPR